MMKTLLAQVKQYKSASILAPVFTAGEVIMEVLIPFVTASIIEKALKRETSARSICTAASCWPWPC